MPEINFRVRWPDGREESCYSPSLVVKKYFEPGTAYPVAEFVNRARESLTIASDRVQAKYGFPCSRALGQLQRIEKTSQQYTDAANETVQIIQFE